MSPDSVRLNPLKVGWGGGGVASLVISPWEERNHNSGSKWRISHGGMFRLEILWENHTSVFGIGISFESCLFASVPMCRVTQTNICIAVSANGGKGTESMVAEEAHGATDCFLNRFLQYLFSCHLSWNPAFLELKWSFWEAEISILKYSWHVSELVLCISEDLNRYCITTECVNVSWAARCRTFMHLR